MAKYISNAIAGKLPPITVDGAAEVVCVRQSVAVDASLAVGDLLLFCKIPAGHEPVGGYASSTDIDTNASPVVAMTFGVLNDAGTDLVSGTDFLTASTIGAACTLAAFNGAGGLNLVGVDAVSASDIGTQNSYVKSGDRVLAAKITTAAATKAAGTVSVALQYRGAVVGQ